MSEWKEYELGEVLDIVIDNRGRNPSSYKESGIPVIDNFMIQNQRSINLSEAKRFIDDEIFDNFIRKYIQPKDVLITLVGNGFGNISQAPKEKSVIIQNTVGLRGNNKIDNEFLFYNLKFMNEEILKFDRGAVQPSIKVGDLKLLNISIPLIEEQKAIAEVLSSLDDKIDLLHRQNKTLEELAQTLFRQWFIEEADDDWAVVTVGDFVKTNSSSIKKDCTLSTIQYLDTSSLTEGKIDTLQLLDLADAPSRAKRIVKHNDVLISTVRPNQKHYGIMKNPTEDIIVSTGFCVISCEKINPHFIYILLTTDDMTEYLHSIAEGSTSTYPSLKPSDIEAVEFLLPPEEKLKVFSDYADNAWNKIDSNYRQMKTLENMRDTLLPKLMSGEVRVEI